MSGMTPEQQARVLTEAVMRHYGYTDADLAEAERVHPGHVCGDECWDGDGRSVHPVYDELNATASVMVEVVLPEIARWSRP